MRSLPLAAMPSELRLMCLAVRRPLDRENAELGQAVAEVGNWPLLLEAAGLHHTLALMVDGLGPDLMAALPQDVRQAYRNRAMDAARRSLARVAELIRLTQALAAVGIRALPLKGVCLAQRLYGNPAMRGGGDIDLLVEPVNFWRAQDVILGLGYTPLAAPAILAEQRPLGQHLIRDIGYRHPQGHLVELHQRLTQDPTLLPLDFETLWQDRQPMAGWGDAVQTLSDRHLALYLCVHGAHHCWERLCWLADIAALLRHPAALAQAIEDCDSYSLRKPMIDCLWLCHLLLGFDLPPSIAADRRAAKWAGRFVRQMVAGGVWAKDFRSGIAVRYGREIKVRMYQYGMKGSWRSLWSQIKLDMQYPIDWAVLRLPDRLTFLYPLIRPAGWLIRRFVAAKNARKATDQGPCR